MKKIFLASLLALGSSTVFMACNNGDYDANPDTNHSDIINPLNPPNKDNYLRGTINGAAYEASTITYVEAGGTVTIQTASGARGVVLTLMGYPGTGDYPAGGSAGKSSTLQYAESASAYASSGGGAYVTSDQDGFVEGTFVFTMTLSTGAGPTPINVTNGKFKIKK